MPRKIKEVSTTGCDFCSLKDKEIEKLKKKVVDLEAEKVPKEKKVYTEEELLAKAEKKAKREKELFDKEMEFKNAIDENKKLKHELLVKFGVELH